MEFSVFRTRIKISPVFFSVLTAFLLIDRNGFASYALLFSFFHECGHILALLYFKTPPEMIEISAFGIHISLKENMSTAEKCLVLTAGFTVNFILAALFFITEKTLFGYINLLIGIFTAVPLPSTDGGAVLRVLLDERVFGKGEKILRICSFCFVGIISAFLIYFGVNTGNFFLFIAVIYMIICAMK